jgi:hypothetical protein
MRNRLTRHGFAAATAFIVLLCVFAQVYPTFAEMMPLDTFWSSLTQTDRLLANRSAEISLEIKTLGQSVDTVLLADGTQMHVDMSWIVSGTSDPSGTALWSLTRRRIESLLNFHNSDANQPHDPAYAARLLSALKEVLQDPRFHYATETPNTPQPQPNNNSDAAVAIVQFIVIVLAVGAIVALLFIAIRGLAVRQRSLPAGANDEADPETSVEARERAGASQQAQDYREAIRYLYLGTLLLLDERGLIHYDKTLTNREHLRQVADKPIITDALRPVVNTFERVWYGFAPVNETLYNEFQQDVDKLQNLAP